jgi:mRNA interferase RelE/StbE
VSEEAWSIAFERRADKDLDRLDAPIKRRVLAAIDRIASEPQAAKLSQLKSRPESRLRVGDWRVLVELEAKTRTIVILRVLPRGRAYDR